MQTYIYTLLILSIVFSVIEFKTNKFIKEKKLRLNLLLTFIFTLFIIFFYSFNNLICIYSKLFTNMVCTVIYFVSSPCFNIKIFI